MIFFRNLDIRVMNRQRLRDHRCLSDYLYIFDQTIVNTNTADCYYNRQYILPNILVVGYYDRGNLGDDAFKSAFSKIGYMTFITCDDFYSVPEGIDVVICGGGDIINPYFMDHIQSVLSTFTGPVYAMSVGIPFITNLKYLDFFDHVIIRTKQDLDAVSKYIHTDNVTYMPDFTTLLKTPGIKRPFTGTPRIGFFLANPAFSKAPEERQLVNKMANLINRVSEFAEVYLLAFNTGLNPNENDIVLNDQIVDIIGPKTNIINVRDTYLRRPEAMLRFMVSLDMSFCMRFHSVMFSLIQNVSFVAMYTTRKVENLLKDVDMVEYGYPLPVDENYIPTDIDIDRAIDLIRYGLNNPNNTYTFSTIDLEYIREILATKKRRTIKVTRVFSKTREEVLENIQQYLMSYLGIDDLTYYQFLMGTVRINDIIGTNDTMTVARLICYAITETMSPPYIWGLNENMINLDDFKLVEAINWIYDDYNTNLEYINDSGIIYPPLTVEKRVLIDMQYIRQDEAKNLHRSGWAYVLGGLYQLDKTVLKKDLPAIVVDTYIDRTFHWASDLLQITQLIPYTVPWVGFLHHTFDTEYSSYNCHELFNKQPFLDSLTTCKAIIVFTNYLADTLRTYLNVHGHADVLVRVLRHPTEIPELKFTTKQFMDNPNKKIIQIGGWLRDSYAIFNLPLDTAWNNSLRIKKAVLKGKEMENYFKPDGLFEYMDDVLGLTNMCFPVCDYDMSCKTDTFYDMSCRANDQDLMCRVVKNTNKYLSGMMSALRSADESVTIIETLENNDYDILLSENIVFLYLIDCSAVNTVIECVVRHTPLIVNRHPAIEELLGTAYPGFYTSMLQASMIATDINIINNITTYLSQLDKTDYLLDTFINKFQDIIIEANKIY